MEILNGKKWKGKGIEYDDINHLFFLVNIYMGKGGMEKNLI